MLRYPEEERGDPALKMTSEQLGSFYESLVADFPIVTIEDPFDQDDWEGWSEFTSKMAPRNVQVVGDDLTVTNVERINTAVEKAACNCLLLKVRALFFLRAKTRVT